MHRLRHAVIKHWKLSTIQNVFHEQQQSVKSAYIFFNNQILETDASPDTDRKVDTLQLFKSVFNAYEMSNNPPCM